MSLTEVFALVAIMLAALYLLAFGAAGSRALYFIACGPKPLSRETLSGRRIVVTDDASVLVQRLPTYDAAVRTGAEKVNMMLGLAIVLLPLTTNSEAAITESRANATLAFVEEATKAPATQFPATKRDLLLRKDEVDEALQWFIRSDRGPEALRFGAAMVRFWRAPEALRWERRILALPSSATTAQRVPFLISASATAFHVGDQSSTQRWAQEALRLAQAAHDDVRVGTAYFRLSQVELRAHGLRNFHRINDTMLQHCRATNDERCETNVRNMKGEAARVERNYDLAERLNQQNVEYGRKNSIESAVRNATVNLAFIDLGRGHTDNVHMRLLDSLGSFEAINSRDMVAVIVAAIGMLRHLQNDSLSAARLLGTSTAELDRLGTLPDPADQDLIAQYTDRIRRSLGRQQFASAFAKGEKIDLESAIAELRR